MPEPVGGASAAQQRLRAVVLAIAAIQTSFAYSAPAQAATTEDIGPAPLTLTVAGQPRTLPARLLSGSAEPFYEHLIGNQVKQGILAAMHLAYLRFPGGTQSNYYDWKSGQIFVTGYSNSSAYTKFWVTLAQQVDTTYPNGISFEDYRAFADAVGADIVMVPNLETSSVADQVSWFAHLAALAMVPTHIELGNEFWVAMGGDPNVEAIWPNEPASMAVMQQYADAFRPYLPSGAKLAVQAAPGSFMYSPTDQGAFYQRLRQWNDDLAPASWFDAVTTHLYSRLDQVTGDPNANQEQVTPTLAQRNYAAMMARYDDGADNALTDLETRLPGKEIWITEWNAEGESSWQPNQTLPITPAMRLQVVTRMELACLRHSSVTVNLFFALNFLTSQPPFDFLPDGKGGFVPQPTTVALGWFFAAANGGATFQRLVEPAAPRIPGGGALPEAYAAVEAGLFTTTDQLTLIVQNAGTAARSVDLTTFNGGTVPTEIDMLSLPDLTDTRMLPAVVTTVPPSLHVTLPSYSVTRIIWQGRSHLVHRHLHH
jgi:hypothetical protein